MSLTIFTPEEVPQTAAEPHLWPRFLLFPAGAVLGYVGLVLQVGGSAWGAQSAWVLFTAFCWFCVTGSFHETAHQTLGRDRLWNIWGGRVIGTLLGIPYTAYRETHIRHHACMNTPDDWELWPYCRDQKSLAFRRAFAWLDLLGAAFVGPFVYGRIYFSHRSPLKGPIRTVLFREYLAVVALWGGSAVVTITLHGLHVVNVWQINPLWLIPLPLAATLNTLRKFTEHLGMSSDDPVLGTRTIIGDNPLTRLSSYFNFEEYIHGVHHRYPKMAHHKLEETLPLLQADRPGVRIPVFSSYRAALWDTLPWILFNPGIGVNAGNTSLRSPEAEGGNIASAHEPRKNAA